MSINNVQLLRALIREMVTEAPYRSSQRVNLSPVRFDGTPSIRGMLMAGGIVGLIKLYDWAEAAFDCGTGRNENFPIIKLPKTLEDALKSPTWAGTTEVSYAAQFNADAVPPAGGDLARVLSFYSSIVDRGAIDAWPDTTNEYVGLADEVADSVANQICKTLSIYSGCPHTALKTKLFGAAGPPVEFKTRKGYLKILADFADSAHSAWETELARQQPELVTHFAADPTAISAINAAFTAAKRVEVTKYDAVKSATR